MRIRICVSLLLAAAAHAQTPPPCTPERASLLFANPPGAVPRFLRCAESGQWQPVPDLCDAPGATPVELAPPPFVDAGVPRPSQAELDACRANCTGQQNACLKTQCGPFQTATCKQRCARTLAICSSGCLPTPPAPPKPAAPPLPVRAESSPAPGATASAPAAAPRPTAAETAKTVFDVVGTGLDVADALLGGPRSNGSSGSTGASSSGGGNVSLTCCLNGVGYRCPSAAAVDRCSGAFMRCTMSGKNPERCLRDSPPDPSSCSRDGSVSCN